MCNPGTTNGALDATTRVWIGDETAVLETVAVCAKTPETKVASPDARVVLTCDPVLSVPVRVTVGMRSFSRADLELLAMCEYAVR